ncbi:chemotaxis protein CheB, partial [Geomonas sp.]|uniref:chemotaxis protein CheB n=1 Tax=Geomonas sp. TaxID=2651584 RepID=UPI002B48A7BF
MTSDHDHPSTDASRDSAAVRPCLVVAIGASAGGQQALEQFFTTIPHDCGLCFAVIMHIPPEGPSFLAEMLSRYTSMAVVTAEEGMELAPDTVFVIPAGHDLTIQDGRLRLEIPSGTHHPIDRFFTSLAHEVKERSVAVVLSGFGTDGTQGVKRIKEAGGIVLVQVPASALNPAMPRSAIATGAADFVLPPEEMPAKVADIAQGNCALPESSCRVTSLDDELQAIFAIVRARTGHDFSSYKKSTLIRRVERRMAVHEVAGMKKYLALLEEDEREAEALGQEILIGVTSFFRDPEAFQLLAREVIPRLFEGRDADDPVRIWHACCATGEEVYSMAMLIREYLTEQRLNARVQLFATDIDEAAIAQARAGIYDDDTATEVGPERLARFFVRANGRWQVNKQLREMVVFAHHSLIKDPPFSRLDLLVCRNFLIYLNPDMQNRLMALFHLALKPKGVLFLGASETVGRPAGHLFAPLDKKWKFFERRESDRRGDSVFPLTSPQRRLQGSVRAQQRPAPSGSAVGSAAGKLLVELYAPPCVVVNEKYEVVHIPTNASRFLGVPVGGATLEILKMAREELRPALRAAMYKCFNEQQAVSFRGLRVNDEEGESSINLLVRPFADEQGENLALVVLEPAGPSPATPPAGEPRLPEDEAPRETLVRQLEEQLRVTHEQLQTTTEQLETSREGFLSANEELMSINEEFQSANEELHSTNEELETSREELQALNEELV